MSEDALRPVPMVVTAHVRTRAQSVLSPAALVRLGVGGTCSFERSQSQIQVVCLVEAERWLGAEKGTPGVFLAGVAMWGFLGVVEAAFPGADERQQQLRP